MTRRDFVKHAGLWVPAAALALPRVTCAAAPWKAGISFRATAPYVTDDPDSVYSLGEATFTTRTTTNGNQISFQWDSAPTVYDRYALADPRLAGMAIRQNTGVQRVLTITLPATGTYLIRFALGDIMSSRQAEYLQVRDDGTPLVTVSKPSTSGSWFWDARGSQYSYTDWPTHNTAVSAVFSTTVCQVAIGTPTDIDANWSTLAFFGLEEYAASGSRSRSWVS